MFSFLKSNPKAKLDKEYQALLKSAMEAQRSGDIRLYSELSEKADKTYQAIQSLEKES